MVCRLKEHRKQTGSSARCQLLVPVRCVLNHGTTELVSIHTHQCPEEDGAPIGVFERRDFASVNQQLCFHMQTFHAPDILSKQAP